MLQKEKLGKMSSKRELPRRKARRGKRSEQGHPSSGSTHFYSPSFFSGQSCFELQGNQQYLHASLSTASLPATLAPTRPSSRISQYRDPLASFKPLDPTSDGSYKHTKSRYQLNYLWLWLCRIIITLQSFASKFGASCSCSARLQILGQKKKRVQ